MFNCMAAVLFPELDRQTSKRGQTPTWVACENSVKNLQQISLTNTNITQSDLE